MVFLSKHENFLIFNIFYDASINKIYTQQRLSFCLLYSIDALLDAISTSYFLFTNGVMNNLKETLKTHFIDAFVASIFWKSHFHTFSWSKLVYMILHSISFEIYSHKAISKNLIEMLIVVWRLVPNHLLKSCWLTNFYCQYAWNIFCSR